MGGTYEDLEPGGLQFLPANLIQAKTQRGQLRRGVIRDEFLSKSLHFREHNLFGLVLACARARPGLDGPLQVLEVVQQHAFQFAHGRIDVARQRQVD